MLCAGFEPLLILQPRIFTLIKVSYCTKKCILLPKKDNYTLRKVSYKLYL